MGVSKEPPVLHIALPPEHNIEYMYISVCRQLSTHWLLTWIRILKVYRNNTELISTCYLLIVCSIGRSVYAVSARAIITSVSLQCRCCHCCFHVYSLFLLETMPGNGRHYGKPKKIHSRDHLRWQLKVPQCSTTNYQKSRKQWYEQLMLAAQVELLLCIEYHG